METENGNKEKSVKIEFTYDEALTLYSIVVKFYDVIKDGRYNNPSNIDLLNKIRKKLSPGNLIFLIGEQEQERKEKK